jgi:hypothetical protein
MEGPPRNRSTSLRLTRGAEPSRLQLDLVRRAFELIVPHKRFSCQPPVRRQRQAAAAATGARGKGD